MKKNNREYLGNIIGHIRVFLVCLLMGLSGLSCGKHKEKIEPIEDVEEGEIYYRWIQIRPTAAAGSNPGNCSPVAGNYKDNNSRMPDYAIEAQFYGPCQPGYYQGQFNFYIDKPSQDIISFNYRLERPPKGYIRYYTKILKAYDNVLARCLSYASADATYVDEKKK